MLARLAIITSRKIKNKRIIAFLFLILGNGIEEIISRARTMVNKMRMVEQG